MDYGKDRKNNSKAKICLRVRGCLMIRGLERPSTCSNCPSSAQSHGMCSPSEAKPVTTTWSTLKQESPKCHLGHSSTAIFLPQKQPQSQRSFAGRGSHPNQAQGIWLLLSINNANKLTLAPSLQVKLLIGTFHFLTMGQCHEGNNFLG